MNKQLYFDIDSGDIKEQEPEKENDSINNFLLSLSLDTCDQINLISRDDKHNSLTIYFK